MRIEEKKKGRKDRSYGYGYYLRELQPIKHKQQIIGNFVEIKEYSGPLHSYELKNGVKYETIYDLAIRYEPIHLNGNVFYSLECINEVFRNYVKEETHKVSNPKEWLRENPKKLFILQILYKKYILNFGVDKGCCYTYDKGDILYFPHKDYTRNLQHINGKQVTRLFKDTTSPFVKHEAIQIDVKIYGNRLFAFFSPTVLFSDCDKKLITGKNVKRLHQKFSPNKYDNNLTIFGDMKWWFEFLCGKGKGFLVTSKLFDFESNLQPPKNSRTRDGLAITRRMEEF